MKTVVATYTPSFTATFVTTMSSLRTDPTYNWRNKLSDFEKALHILSWIIFILVKGVLWVMGLFIVPYCLGRLQIIDDWPEMFWLWDNDEESTPEWFYDLADASSNPIMRWFPNFWWYGMRNTTNNSRFLFKDRPAYYAGDWPAERMRADDLIRVGRMSATRWAYNGPFASWRKMWLELPIGTPTEDQRYSEYWVGWKIGNKTPGLGFTLQRAKHRKIGT